VIAASFNNAPDRNVVAFFLKLFGSWYGGVFIFAEFSLIYLVNKTRNNALDIYDELYPDGIIET
jgi:hypothetical protein